MIIVNWQKDVVVNMETAKTVEVSKRRIYDDTHYIVYSIIATLNDDTVINLGNYKTEERAKEVLRDIITTFSTFEVYKNSTQEVKNQIAIQLYNSGRTLEVFEIPLV